MRTLSYTVPAERAGASVKSILSNELALSKALISRLKARPKGILLNGEKVYTAACVRSGDILSVEIGDDPASRRAAPMEFPLRILYEDEDLLILDKPAGLTVHPDSRRPTECTLENALSFYLPEGDFPHPVSRLDRGTSGVITFAKNGYMHERLRRMQHTSQFVREYRAICVGRPDPPGGVVSAPIGFYPLSRYRRAVTADGAPSQTEYETLSSFGGLSLLRLLPRTGRTHQLRVHMAEIGCPLLADWLYGTRDDRLDRPALHSYRLSLTHPLTGEQLDVSAPIPEDLNGFSRLFETQE